MSSATSTPAAPSAAIVAAVCVAEINVRKGERGSMVVYASTFTRSGTDQETPAEPFVPAKVA